MVIGARETKGGEGKSRFENCCLYYFATGLQRLDGKTGEKVQHSVLCTRADEFTDLLSVAEGDHGREGGDLVFGGEFKVSVRVDGHDCGATSRETIEMVSTMNKGMMGATHDRRLRGSCWGK